MRVSHRHSCSDARRIEIGPEGAWSASAVNQAVTLGQIPPFDRAFDLLELLLATLWPRLTVNLSAYPLIKTGRCV